MRPDPPPSAAVPFAQALLAWFAVHGRHDLPWQHPRDPYRVWVSEVMLQQTQVGTVIPYFQRFMGLFPSVKALADAPLDDVLKHWAGLGYYARARNLHRAAGQIVARHRGELPADIAALRELPGIGRSTAGAILAQAFGQRQAILDGNVRRVLARYRGIDGWPGLPKVQAQLWDVAESLLPQTRLADYTQALMDLGNAVCTVRAPQCTACPVASDCRALAGQRVQALPTPRPRRIRPQRTAYLLVMLSDDGEVLLEQRPGAGLWGGLWSLPMSALDESWADFAARSGLPETAPRGVSIDHAFTHFDLAMIPVQVAAASMPNTVRDTPAGAWIKLSRPDGWPGMPTPIRKLVEHLGRQREPAPPTSTEIHAPCPAPSSASSSSAKPRRSNARRTPARSGSASS
ncbi:MAG: A/G-specific adenine glycosylase [Panacagrimonas sp.]